MQRQAIAWRFRLKTIAKEVRRDAWLVLLDNAAALNLKDQRFKRLGLGLAKSEIARSFE